MPTTLTFLSRATDDNKSCVNHGQRIPWVSKDITKDQSAYGALMAALGSPDFAHKLEAYIDILPHNAACPWAPFGGIVVNINACSDVHRDVMDLYKCCIVIPLQKCEGRGLVLHEARLVLDLCTGHAVLFPSGRFTHFNLHYQGVRVSLVFHTDSNSKMWVPVPEGAEGGGGHPGGNGWIRVNGVWLESSH
ncbi:hypothetical protein C8R44DRAFT_748233 [Mycena epipterygia]|nr:hypothetical protein C8R44DRAFT_748233 [Mycena epipterygia]